MSTVTKPCDQTSLATDNTPLECEEFISSACIIHPDALVELSIPENSTVQEIINAFLNAIINLNNQIGTENSSVVSGEVVGTDLVLTKSDATTVIIDASAFFDDTNLARIVSGAVIGTDLVLTRDDATDVTVDVSALLDNTNLPRIVSGLVVGNDLILTRDDATDVTIDVSSLGGGGGGITSVVAGTEIGVDNTDPLNPIVSVEGAETVAALPITTVFNDLFVSIPANVNVFLSKIGNIVHYEGFISLTRNPFVATTNYTTILQVTLPINVVSTQATGSVHTDGLVAEPQLNQWAEVRASGDILELNVFVTNALVNGGGSATLYFTGTYRTG